MRFLILRAILAAFEMVHESVENWTRNTLGEINLTILHLVAQLISAFVFTAFVAVPFATFQYLGALAGCISIVSALGILYCLVRSQGWRAL
ncbi:MAG: hypothetical protein RLZZ622_792 [Planctomycetota bacterium]